MYGKLNGRANTENKYDFPPPIDNALFFGSCLLIGTVKNKQNNSLAKEKKTDTFVELTIELWNKIYEKLFGGFEDLTTSLVEDENEHDELDNIPKNKKTKVGGYLKDGFVVDDNEESDFVDESDDENASLCKKDNLEQEQEEDTPHLQDIGSELSEDSYDYSDMDE